ncbi:MAG: TVP38/TMEM64 family protein [Clostridia bacterium]|nr:TVP38/TMEM64 family protein [Clostridia bacterium]
MKKIILKALLIIAVIGFIALGVFALMKALHVDTIDGLREVCNNNGFYAYVIIVVLQVIQVVFIPISNQIITIPAIAVVGILPAFLCSWIGIEIGTIILYCIGRKGGGKLLAWLLSDTEKADKFAELVKTRKLFYPVGMLIGVIPDDLLTTVAGLSKINFWYVLTVSLITRGICTATTVFSFGILTQTWWGIIILVFGIVALCVIGYLFLRYEPKIEAWFKNKSKKR